MEDYGEHTDSVRWPPVFLLRKPYLLGKYCAKMVATSGLIIAILSRNRNLFKYIVCPILVLFDFPKTSVLFFIPTHNQPFISIEK